MVCEQTFIEVFVGKWGKERTPENVKGALGDVILYTFGSKSVPGTVYTEARAVQIHKLRVIVA